MAVAYCWRDGRLECASRAPKGALVLANGPMRLLRKITSTIGRHGYDGRTLLVPGIPEADTDLEALEAARRFQVECRRRLAVLAVEPAENA